VIALAAAAGVAIDNARLFAVAQRRERWLTAAAEITSVLLGHVHRTDALRLIARRAREVTDAELVLVLLYDDPAARFTVEVVDGPDRLAAGLTGVVLPANEASFVDAVRQARHVQVEDLRTAADWPVFVPEGPAMIAPLAGSDTLNGALIVSGRALRGPRDDADVTLLTSFAGQAALALERARAQEERELLVVLDDRERIARDLHDMVIQRLFATGMQLQGALPHAIRPRSSSESMPPSTISMPPSATSVVPSFDFVRRSVAACARSWATPSRPLRKRSGSVPCWNLRAGGQRGAGRHRSGNPGGVTGGAVQRRPPRRGESGTGFGARRRRTGRRSGRGRRGRHRS
jgi:hypothetical protein